MQINNSSSSFVVGVFFIFTLISIFSINNQNHNKFGVVHAQASNCGDGWTGFADFCYKTWPIVGNDLNESLPTAMSFYDAQTFCAGQNAHIAPIQNLTQLQFMQDLIGNTSGRKFWNGVYADPRFHSNTQIWRTVYNRTYFNDFFLWDTHRGMPRFEDCIVVHNYGDLSKRVVGGNHAMITYPCNKRAEVICARRQHPWGITAVNTTVNGAVLAVEGRPLVLNFVGVGIPRGMQVQLQTTDYTTHAGLEGQPTQCAQVKPRNPILLNVSQPALATNVSIAHDQSALCNGTCWSTNVHFPLSLKLERGKKYSICVFLPYHYGAPTSSDEFYWNFLPNAWVEVAESRENFLRETCARRKDLVELLYYDNTATDAKRNVPSPYYFDGPVEPDNYYNAPSFIPSPI